MNPAGGAIEGDPNAFPQVESTPKKKGRTNTPWTAEEEQRLEDYAQTQAEAGPKLQRCARVSFLIEVMGPDLCFSSIADLLNLVLRSTGTRYAIEGVPDNMTCLSYISCRTCTTPNSPKMRYDPESFDVRRITH